MCKTLPSELLPILERVGPTHIDILQAPATPAENYLKNLTETAEHFGVQLTVGSIVVSDSLINKEVELEALDAFLSQGAERGCYVDSDAILGLFVLPCFSQTGPCADESCKKCNGLGSDMTAFLAPPVYWSRK
jgi:hypothetical protein